MPFVSPTAASAVLLDLHPRHDVLPGFCRFVAVQHLLPPAIASTLVLEACPLISQRVLTVCPRRPHPCHQQRSSERIQRGWGLYAHPSSGSVAVAVYASPFCTISLRATSAEDLQPRLVDVPGALKLGNVLAVAFVDSSAPSLAVLHKPLDSSQPGGSLAGLLSPLQRPGEAILTLLSSTAWQQVTADTPAATLPDGCEHVALHGLRPHALTSVPGLAPLLILLCADGCIALLHCGAALGALHCSGLDEDSGQAVAAQIPSRIWAKSMLPGQPTAQAWSRSLESTPVLAVCLSSGGVVLLSVAEPTAFCIRSIEMSVPQPQPANFCVAVAWLTPQRLLLLPADADGRVIQIEGLASPAEDGTVVQVKIIGEPVAGSSYVNGATLCSDSIISACADQCCLRILRHGRSARTLFLSPPVFPTVTGVWGLPGPGKETGHALLVVSFVSGTRVLWVAGDDWTDVTEGSGIIATRSTLAAGVLFHAGWCFLVQASLGTPRAARVACSQTPMCAQVHESGVSVSSPSCFGPQASSALLECAYWEPPLLPPGLASPGKKGTGSRDTISVAAVCPTGVVLSLARLRVLLLLRLATPAGAAPTSALPRGSLLLECAASIDLSAELSCVSIEEHDWDGAPVCVAGTYAPSVVVFSMSPGSELHPLASYALTDEAAEEPAGNRPVPESVLLTSWGASSVGSHDANGFAPALPAADTLLLVGMRGGRLLELHRSRGTEQCPPEEALRVAHTRRLGQAPVVLVPLGAKHSHVAVALSDRPWVLQAAPGLQCLTASPLCAPHARYGTALSVSHLRPGVLLVEPDRLRLLAVPGAHCGSPAGRYCTLETVPLHNFSPSQVAAHAPSGTVIVAGDSLLPFPAPTTLPEGTADRLLDAAALHSSGDVAEPMSPSHSMMHCDLPEATSDDLVPSLASSLEGATESDMAVLDDEAVVPLAESEEQLIDGAANSLASEYESPLAEAMPPSRGPAAGASIARTGLLCQIRCVDLASGQELGTFTGLGAHEVVQCMCCWEVAEEQTVSANNALSCSPPTAGDWDSSATSQPAWAPSSTGEPCSSWAHSGGTAEANAVGVTSVTLVAAGTSGGSQVGGRLLLLRLVPQRKAKVCTAAGSGTACGSVAEHEFTSTTGRYEWRPYAQVVLPEGAAAVCPFRPESSAEGFLLVAAGRQLFCLERHVRGVGGSGAGSGNGSSSRGSEGDGRQPHSLRCVAQLRLRSPILSLSASGHHIVVGDVGDGVQLLRLEPDRPADGGRRLRVVHSDAAARVALAVVLVGPPTRAPVIFAADSACRLVALCEPPQRSNIVVSDTAGDSAPNAQSSLVPDLGFPSQSLTPLASYALCDIPAALIPWPHTYSPPVKVAPGGEMTQPEVELAGFAVAGVGKCGGIELLTVVSAREWALLSAAEAAAASYPLTRLPLGGVEAAEVAAAAGAAARGAKLCVNLDLLAPLLCAEVALQRAVLGRLRLLTGAAGEVLLKAEPAAGVGDHTLMQDALEPRQQEEEQAAELITGPITTVGSPPTVAADNEDQSSNDATIRELLWLIERLVNNNSSSPGSVGR